MVVSMTVSPLLATHTDTIGTSLKVYIINFSDNRTFLGHSTGISRNNYGSLTNK